MMKAVLLLAVASSLIGCASKPVTVEGIETSKGATFTMLGSRPADQVAVCMAQTLQTTVQRQGQDYVMTIHQQPPADTVIYRVRAINDPYKRFLTQVEQSGYNIEPQPSLGECLPKTS